MTQSVLFAANSGEIARVVSRDCVFSAVDEQGENAITCRTKGSCQPLAFTHRAGCPQSPFPRTDFWDALGLDDIAPHLLEECPSSLNSPPFPDYEPVMHEDSEELCHIPGDAFPELQHIPLEINEQGSTNPADAGAQSTKYQHRVPKNQYTGLSVIAIPWFWLVLSAMAHSSSRSIHLALLHPCIKLYILCLSLRKGCEFTDIVTSS